jgi:hypothetical protein
LRVAGVFQHTLETPLILAFANPIFVLHRLIPFCCATRFVTIIRALRTGVGGSVRRQSGGAAFQNQRPGQTCNARVDARFATASLSDHHTDAGLLEVAKIGVASLVALSIGVQSHLKK